eukprot:scaffold53527_cov20-Tisochrysis_lutea.AAC.5
MSAAFRGAAVGDDWTGRRWAAGVNKDGGTACRKWRMPKQSCHSRASRACTDPARWSPAIPAATSARAALWSSRDGPAASVTATLPAAVQHAHSAECQGSRSSCSSAGSTTACR